MSSITNATQQGGSSVSRSTSTPSVPDVWALVQRDYRVGDVINTGRDGTVLRKGVFKETGETVALKSIPLSGRSKREMARREADLIMHKLDHDCIMKCFDFFEGTHEAVIVLEFCGGGDLLDVVNNHSAFREEEARKMFITITTGLLESHRQNIAHRDIKLENILLRTDGSIVIGDYGLARCYSPGELFHSPCGTLTYAAPELHDDPRRMKVEPEPADVFALGVVLYALITARLPFNGTTDEEVVTNILKGKYDMPPMTSESLRSLLSSMLAVNPKQRPTLRAILNHQWVNPDAPITPTLTPTPLSFTVKQLSSTLLATASAVSTSATSSSSTSSSKDSKKNENIKKKHSHRRQSMFTVFCRSIASAFTPKITNQVVH